MQSVAKATARQSFAVTTGTGSGKSLCFLIPIINAAIRARASGEEPRTRAIVIYPMNALANSQREELTKFLDLSGLPENLRPTFARYTGQEDQDERERIREAKPDILLTNFMMLELLMTRQNKLDQTVIENAQGLDFIVLDELHTWMWPASSGSRGSRSPFTGIRCRAWPGALSRWGLPLPDGEPLIVNGAVLPLAWRAHLAAAVFGPVADETRAAAEALGFTVATVPDEPGDAPPPELAEMLRGAA
jgi:DEAD/DEAH box helicase